MRGIRFPNATRKAPVPPIFRALFVECFPTAPLCEPVRLFSPPSRGSLQPMIRLPMPCMVSVNPKPFRRRRLAPVLTASLVAASRVSLASVPSKAARRSGRNNHPASAGVPACSAHPMRPRTPRPQGRRRQEQSRHSTAKGCAQGLEDSVPAAAEDPNDHGELSRRRARGTPAPLPLDGPTR